MKTRRLLIIPGITALLLAGCSSNASTQSSVAVISEVSTSEVVLPERKPSTGPMIVQLPHQWDTQYEIELKKAHVWNPPEFDGSPEIHQDGFKLVAVDMTITNHSFVDEDGSSQGVYGSLIGVMTNAFYYEPDGTFRKCTHTPHFETPDGEYENMQPLMEYILPGESKNVVIVYKVAQDVDLLHVVFDERIGFDIAIEP